MAAPHLCWRSRINKGAVRGKMEFGSARLILFYCVSLARSLELAAHCSGVWCFPPIAGFMLSGCLVSFISMCILPQPLSFSPAQRQIAHHSFPALFHPSVFSLFRRVSFCPFSTIMRTIFFVSLHSPRFALNGTVVTAGPAPLTPSENVSAVAPAPAQPLGRRPRAPI